MILGVLKSMGKRVVCQTAISSPFNKVDSVGRKSSLHKWGVRQVQAAFEVLE